MHVEPHDKAEGYKVWLSDDEAYRFLDTEPGERRLGFQLGLRCGLRGDEVVGIAPADVRTESPIGPCVDVRESVAKGGARRVPVSQETAHAIDAVGGYRSASRQDPLVDVSTRTYARWVSARGKALADETGEERFTALSSHDLRRTWAQLLLDAGVSTLCIFEWAGWSEPESARPYFRKDAEVVAHHPHSGEKTRSKTRLG